MKFRLLSAILLLTAFSACKKEDPIKVQLSSYPLPGDQLFPEGLAYNLKTGIFYTGSTVSGDVVQVDVETGKAVIFAAGAKQGRADCRGMKVDYKERLWICGGEENKIHVLSSKGELIKSWDVKTLFGSGFINDCTADEKYIYFTDSRVQKIYRADVSSSQPGDPEEWLSFTNQQIPFSTGFNSNGAALTPDGKYLIIVISNSGKLYKINRQTKAISEITLNIPVTAGDGLWLDGKTLYVSRNSANKVFPVMLNDDYSSGTVGNAFGDNLLFNTTIAKAGKYLLVLNSQLNKRGMVPGPQLPFTVSRVVIP